MSYRFVSMEDAGTGTGDVIMRLRWTPSQLRRWLRAEEDMVSYYGQGARWHAMDGLPASSRVRLILETLWQTRQQDSGAARDHADAVDRTACIL
jgi:hypothetical protein